MCIETVSRISNFNSIKVQLKHAFLLSSSFSLSDFNSIKVQLKRMSALDLLTEWIFQFHKGTIKTRSPYQQRRRLRQFQFHKGTIKTKCFYLIYINFYNFNSIKVQLKLPGVKFSVSVRRFQFHKGTIKTVERVGVVVFCRISIP